MAMTISHLIFYLNTPDLFLFEIPSLNYYLYSGDYRQLSGLHQQNRRLLESIYISIPSEQVEHDDEDHMDNNCI